MNLQHIHIENLTVSPLNVRKYGAKDCADLVTSIRAMGLLQPLLVRPAADGFEVIAGQRRLNALRILAEETGEAESDPIPCIVMGKADDAAAIEASLAENLERLPMDEVDQYKGFSKLVKEGRDVAEIASSFGITERMVEQRLALGRLHGPILTAYRKGDLHARDIRILTMASPKQQKEWWALVKNEEAYVPTGQRLKDWLFGGAHIPIANALFYEEASGLTIVSDLFGEEAYFADSLAFWKKQNESIVEMMADYQEAGWAEVTVMDIGAYFATWDHRKTSKKDGGKVFIACSAQGEVTAYEGYLTNAEAKRREKTEAQDQGAALAKPELTKPAQNYVDLHRHATVRADLLGNPGIALRLIAAHMIAGSDLWQVQADPQRAAKETIAESLERNGGHIAIEAERGEIAKLLGLGDEHDMLERKGDWSPRPEIAKVFKALQAMGDETIVRILTFLMADSLAVTSPLIDALGQTMNTDIRKHWEPDQTFLDLIRDKQVLNGMVGDYAGEAVAREHLTEPAKTQRAILTACMEGTRKPTDPDWTPRYMTFPQGSYRADALAEPVVEDTPQQEAA
ncbi:MAG: ParB N-terminal domain-containing protein [Pseudomonadota bacterium]